MNRSIVAALALALTTAFAVPAMADGTAHEHAARLEFPAPAAAFQQRVEARLAKGRARMESAVAAKKLTPEHAAAWRTKLDQRATRVELEIEKVAADGVVTKEEAKAVREAIGHHHHGGRGGRQARAHGAKKA